MAASPPLSSTTSSSSSFSSTPKHSQPINHFRNFILLY
ncbi:unnamed protein product, partial [Vitis vinifera]|uniref:Uncharacterized protein n=1 Tax=Vitis vinifera TaxID=29760 RepID=D7SWC2_VITVI